MLILGAFKICRQIFDLYMYVGLHSNNYQEISRYVDTGTAMVHTWASDECRIMEYWLFHEFYPTLLMSNKLKELHLSRKMNQHWEIHWEWLVEAMNLEQSVRIDHILEMLKCHHTNIYIGLVYTFRTPYVKSRIPFPNPKLQEWHITTQLIDINLMPSIQLRWSLLLDMSVLKSLQVLP